MMYIDKKYYRDQLICNAYLHNRNTDNGIGDEGIQHLKLPAHAQIVDLSSK